MIFYELLKLDGKLLLKKIPILLVLLIGLSGAIYLSLPTELVNHENEIRIKVAVSMKNPPTVFSEILTFLENEENISEIKQTTPEEGITQVKAGKVDVYIAFPDNLKQVLFAGQSGTIQIATNQPLVDAYLEQFLRSGVQALNDLQGNSLSFRHSLAESALSASEKARLAQKFDGQLTSLAIFRHQYLDLTLQMGKYRQQILSLLFFLMIILPIFFSGMIFLQQRQQAFLRKLQFHKVSFGALFLSKYLLLVLFNSLITTAFAGLFNLNLSYLMLGMILLTALVWSGQFLLTLLLPKNFTQGNYILISGIFFLSLLFVGGLIYPLEIQLAGINRFNPAWSSQLVVASAYLRQSLSIKNITDSIVESLILIGLGWLVWRRKRCE